MKIMELHIAGAYRFLQCECGSSQFTHTFERPMKHTYKCAKCDSVFVSEINYPCFYTIENNGEIKEVKEDDGRLVERTSVSKGEKNDAR